VPCDDGVVWQLHELHDIHNELRPLIEHSLGAREAYPNIRSRGQFLKIAADIGIRVPRTRTVAAEEELNDWDLEAPAVLKLDGTWGGEGVKIVQSRSAAMEAFRSMSRPMSAETALKRRLVNCDPIALWTWQRREIPRVTIQEFIPGRPANAMFACWKGEVLGIVSVEAISTQGATGAATVVRIVQNAEIERAARLLAGEFRLSGFHGLDFILDQQSGAAYLIELNPRSTQLGHLQVNSQIDLAGAISRKLWNDREPKPAELECPVRGDTLAFFPQAFNWNPKSPYLRCGYHDVPWEEPALVRELLRKSWPERQWLNRLYHFFRPPKREGEVKF
jgi:predicted ATP-grasp superfamily ATP-dependent carboligase